MTSFAADNPCTENWQWQWKTNPTLDITGPTTLPDTCVGQHSIGPAIVTAEAGVKWEVDINSCDPPPFTRNETSVPISPVNTWSLYLYPPGTTPVSGNGTTANFTTIHGGSVVVQFETRATVASPPWDSGPLAHRTSPFRVFEVISLEPNAGTEVDDGDGNTNTRLFIVCGTLAPPNNIITVTATPAPVALASDLPTCWTLSGDACATIVDKLTATIDGSQPKRCSVTATAGTSTKTTTVIVLRTDLKSIEFTSDHGVLRDNNTDWFDSGTAYGTPEWIRDPARNYPISHTKNVSISLTATVKVEPAGVPFDLLGDGPDNYVDFTKTGNSSTGGDQPISISAAAALPNQVAILSKSISWSIRAYGLTCGSWSSGAHTNYVTYGTPEVFVT